MSRFFRELKRRKVYQVGVTYLLVAFVGLQVAELLIPSTTLPDWADEFLIAILIVGFPVALVIAWAFDITPDGVRRAAATDAREERAAPGDPEPGTSDAGTRPESGAVSSRPEKRRNLRVALLAGAILVVLSVAVVGLQEFLTDDGRGEWVARQLLEIDRLRDRGQYAAAFVLATEVEPHITDDTEAPELWDRISWSADIETDPPGARVYRQLVYAPEDEWELLGTTPLATVRFAEDQGYRLRFELEGHRPVELLHTAIRGAEWRGAAPLKPVKLYTVDELPEDMVRIPGFTRDLVDYDDYFMDRFEVTNEQYAQFVAAGGYENPEHWVEPFIRDGKEVVWEEAVSSFVDRTGRPGPSTWRLGTWPDGEGDYPVRGVSWYEAAAYARFAGKELLTTAHWEGAARFQREDNWLIMTRSNLGGGRPPASWRKPGHDHAGHSRSLWKRPGVVLERGGCGRSGHAGRRLDGLTLLRVRGHSKIRLGPGSYPRAPLGADLRRREEAC
ncbi:MAG: SUMF1/EgtB/PvdO family nonheme iron enzyme [Xanthomonadales bacterium]|nr:SUMF1/EgtB/PvdO family nonheme iron enzyme [Xanthomonadales bacterium]